MIMQKKVRIAIVAKINCVCKKSNQHAKSSYSIVLLVYVMVTASIKYCLFTKVLFYIYIYIYIKRPPFI